MLVDDGLARDQVGRQLDKFKWRPGCALLPVGVEMLNLGAGPCDYLSGQFPTPR